MSTINSILERIPIEYNTENYIYQDSIKVNENSFAIREGKSIKFFTYSNNKFIQCGIYTNNYIFESSYLIQMKIENENLIIITTKFYVIEKIKIINDIYTFTNIITQKLDEEPLKLLNDYKFVSFNDNIFKIYQLLFEEKTIKCLFEISYEIFESTLTFNNKSNDKINFENKGEDEDINDNEEKEEEEEEEEEKEEFEDAEIKFSNRLCDIIEIQDKKIIIASFAKEKYINTFDDFDHTFCKYGILIIDSINYQIKTNICNLIEAEKLIYYGGDELYSFGIRKFFKLNLKKIKLELILNEKEINDCCHYYHYNFIPFLNLNKIFCFGYYRCGTWMGRKEYRHLCLYDITNNTLNEINYNENYNIEYFPLKLDNDKILIVEDKGIELLKLKNILI